MSTPKLLFDCFTYNEEQLIGYKYVGENFIGYSSYINFEQNSLIHMKYDISKNCINIIQNNNIKLILTDARYTRCWYPYYKLCISPTKFHNNSRLMIKASTPNHKIIVKLFVKIDKLVINRKFGNHPLTEFLIVNNTLQHYKHIDYNCKQHNINPIYSNAYIQGTKRDFFPHQIYNIEWGCSREYLPITLTIPIIPMGFVKSSHTELLIHDLNYEIILPKTLPTKTITINGGMLCDQVGLGKTYTFLGLCIQNKVKSTLIACPGYLCNHWYNEILKYTNMSVYRICNIVQFVKFHNNKQQHYDIIICSFNIFINEKCLQSINTSMHEMHFNRVIIDEVHTLFELQTKKGKMIIEYIQKCMMNATHKWLCTSTPNFNYKDKNIYYLQKYLQLLTTPDLKLQDFLYSYVELFDRIVRRNTLSSIENIIQIPQPNIENIFLEPTEVEKIIYETALNDKQKQIELCSHVLVSEVYSNILEDQVMSVEDATHKFIEYYAKRLDYYKKREQSLQVATVGFSGTQSLEELQNLKTKTKDIIGEATACLQIFQGLQSKILEECPICLQSLNDVNPTVAICGHIYCTSCISTMFKMSQQQINCALCRRSLTKANFKNIQTSKYKPITNDIKWGTKMSTIIEYLNTILKDPKRRIIIFSKFNKMLKLIEKTFIENGLNIIRVKGAPFQADALIQKFKTQTIYRIIMLCSESMSSGINLTEATDVILLDTFTANSASVCKALETQAIGRAVRLGQKNNVEVRRFIMRNTIEEELFKMNCM